MLPESETTLSTGASALVRPAAHGATVGVVALHPWGPLGGSMHDPTVRAVTRFFGSAGCATCRVQFRSGLGRGAASVADATAAADALLALDGVSRVVVAGYSYGACVAVRAAAALDRAALVGWAAINPPLDYAWFLYAFHGGHRDAAADLACARLLVHATADVFCANASFDAFAAAVPDPKTVARLPNRGHFDVAVAIPGALAAWVADLGCADAAAFARAPPPPPPR